MKTLKIITGVLSGISALITVTMPILSSNMQGFYKSQIDDFSKNTQELLDKKLFWAQIGESNVFAIVFIICVCLFLGILFIDFVNKRKNK